MIDEGGRTRKNPTGFFSESTQMCETCFSGLNHATGDEYEPWGRCDRCNARALNGAQLRDLGIMQEAHGQVLIGACLGSRKTGTTAAFINRNRGVWLGVIPVNTMQQWVDAIGEFSPGTIVHVITTRDKLAIVDLKNGSESDVVYLIGWELMRRQDWRIFKKIDGAFADESHRAAGDATGKALNRINSKWRIALSGTPAYNALQNLWNILHWIWWGNADHKTHERRARYRVKWGDFVNPGWILRHFQVYNAVYGDRAVMEIGAEKRFHSVVDEIPTFIQHLEEEYCCEFHPKGVNATLPPKDDPTLILVDMTPAQAKMYEKCDGGAAVLWLNQFDSELREETVERVPLYIGESALVERLRLRQIALGTVTLDEEGNVTMAPDTKSAICDMWLDLAQDIVEPGDPVLVFTHSKVFAKIVVERTNKRFGKGFASEWSGDVNALDREILKERFGKQDGPQVIVAVIASIAEGVDGLQNVCRREVWLSEDDNMMLNTQARGRLRRTGQKRRTQSWYIMSRGTIMEKQYKVLRKNKALLDAQLKVGPIVGDVDLGQHVVHDALGIFGTTQ